LFRLVNRMAWPAGGRGGDVHVCGQPFARRGRRPRLARDGEQSAGGAASVIKRCVFRVAYVAAPYLPLLVAACHDPVRKAGVQGWSRAARILTIRLLAC
jgi:hypothetical protein